MGFLRVAIDVPLPRLFDYRCDGASPKDIGLRGVVPFGSRKIVGIIFDVVSSSGLPPGEVPPAALPRRLSSANPLPRPLPVFERFYALTEAGDAGRVTLPARRHAR